MFNSRSMEFGAVVAEIGIPSKTGGDSDAPSYPRGGEVHPALHPCDGGLSAVFLTFPLI